MLSVNLAIILPFLAAILIPILYKKITSIHIGWFTLLVPAALFIFFASTIPAIADGETFAYTINWLPSFGINFTTYLDGLSMIFVLLITGIGALVTIYSIYYLSSNEKLGHFYTYLLLFMGAMLGVVLSDNIYILYVFWELTSISSFLLIAFWYQRKQSRMGAQKSLLITVGGGFAMLVGFIMLHVMTGETSIRAIIAESGQYFDHTLFIPAMILILLGAFTKSAQFPFHIWLPDAMEAPTPVSAYLHSATMVKAGIYLVARFTPVFGGDAVWFWLVTGVGLLTLFWGAFTAIRQTDLKAMLAFSTISQLGMIMSMFGLGSAALNFGYSTDSVAYTQATFAALFHLINHSTFKGALFMVVGIVDHEVGTRDLRKLGGLWKLMPATFIIAAIGSFSMAGLPLFNGFLSKEMFFTSAVNITELEIFALETWAPLIPIVAWVASVFTFIYCMIIVFKTFLGPYQEEKLERPAHEAPVGMLVAPSVLAALIILIFFFPNAILGEHIIRPAMSSIFPSFAAQGGEMGVEISAWHGWDSIELWMTIAIVVIGSLLYVTLRYWKGIYRIVPKHWSFNAVYSWTLEKTTDVSKQITNGYMTGYLKHYMMYIFLFFIIVVGGGFLISGSYDFTISGNAPISGFEWFIAISMMIAAISMLIAKSRFTAIILNSVLGYGIAVLFVFFRAPDLALTQTIVETVTTVLFLVTYYLLPAWDTEEKTPLKTKINKWIISILVGATFTGFALAVQNKEQLPSISSFFENAYELAGGQNIVNSILGDFRALDTMLEVIVLLIAGIGVFALIKLKAGKGGTDKYEDK